MPYSVQPGRFLDGAMLSVFTMLLSAVTLYMFGELCNLLQDERFSQWKMGWIMRQLFRFRTSFDFGLTHILLFSICILVLSFKADAKPPRHKEPKRVTSDSSS